MSAAMGRRAVVAATNSTSRGRSQARPGPPVSAAPGLPVLRCCAVSGAATASAGRLAAPAGLRWPAVVRARPGSAAIGRGRSAPVPAAGRRSPGHAQCNARSSGSRAGHRRTAGPGPGPIRAAPVRHACGVDAHAHGSDPAAAAGHARVAAQFGITVGRRLAVERRVAHRHQHRVGEHHGAREFETVQRARRVEHQARHARRDVQRRSWGRRCGR